MIKIRKSDPSEIPEVLQIWRRSVDATHDFVDPEDWSAIDHDVQEMLPQLPLWVSVDEHDRPTGFMSLSDLSLDALFIDPLHHGKGIGKAMIEFALRSNAYLMADVNEQNLQAIAFYERQGFQPTGRSPEDSRGRAYPLIHMKLDPRA